MTFKRNMIAALVLGTGALISTGCNRTLDDEDFIDQDGDGKEMKAASADFAVTETFDFLPFKSINFGIQPGYFEAKFSEEVTWTVTVRNKSNNAIKVFQETSDEINIDNTSWRGRSDNVEFFAQGDSMVATLTVLGEGDIASLNTLRVSQPIQRDQQTIDGIYHILIDDFDGGGNAALASATDGKDKTKFEAGDLRRAQGNSFRLSGTDQLPTNGWLGDLSSDLLALRGLDLFNTTDPANLYFNVLIFGTGSENTQVQLFTWELDDQADYDDINYTVFKTNENDKYVYDVTVNWTGWRVVRIPYNQFQKANDPNVGGNGNKKKEPKKITAAGVSLLSGPTQGATVDVSVDYIVLTEGGPFKQ